MTTQNYDTCVTHNKLILKYFNTYVTGVKIGVVWFAYGKA